MSSASRGLKIGFPTFGRWGRHTFTYVRRCGAADAILGDWRGPCKPTRRSPDAAAQGPEGTATEARGATATPTGHRTATGRTAITLTSQTHETWKPKAKAKKPSAVGGRGRGQNRPRTLDALVVPLPAADRRPSLSLASPLPAADRLPSLSLASHTSLGELAAAPAGAAVGVRALLLSPSLSSGGLWRASLPSRLSSPLPAPSSCAPPSAASLAT
eukprot:540170-Prymnesium_polylepis.1